MKKIYTLFLFGFIVSNVFSQQVLKSPFVAAADKCGFSAEMEKNRVRGFNDAAYEAEMQRLINEFKQLNNFGPPTTIFSVPIIFHVIYDGNTESTIGTGANLTQAIVTAQIQQLNADFANLSGSGYWLLPWYRSSILKKAGRKEIFYLQPSCYMLCCGQNWYVRNVLW